jgi:hypothetical protein
MAHNYSRTQDELQETFLSLKNEGICCGEALVAMADLMMQIALTNYQRGDMARMLIGRMEQSILDWKAQHHPDGDHHQIY